MIFGWLTDSWFLEPPHLSSLSLVWQLLHLIKHHFTHFTQPRPVWQCHNSDSKTLLQHQAHKSSNTSKQFWRGSKKMIHRDCNGVSTAPALVPLALKHITLFIIVVIIITLVLIILITIIIIITSSARSVQVRRRVTGFRDTWLHRRQQSCQSFYTRVSYVELPTVPEAAEFPSVPPEATQSFCSWVARDRFTTPRASGLENLTTLPAQFLL